MNFEYFLSRFFEHGSFPEDAFYIQKTFQGRKIIVYGAGESFHYFKEVVMRQYGYIPSVVLDRKFRPGDAFEGISAFSSMDYQPSAEELETGLVVVCLGNQSYIDDVVKALQQIGFNHIITLMDIYEIHNPFCLPQELKVIGFKYFMNQRERIESCLDILADACKPTCSESRFQFPCATGANSIPPKTFHSPEAIRVSFTAE
jgi:hypothetical protein